jgi:two-component system sensor histidine kinase DesK
VAGFFCAAGCLFPVLSTPATVGDTARPPAGAGPSVGRFCLIYTFLVWGAFEGFFAKRHQVIGYVVLAAMGLGLAIAYDFNWLLLMLYVSTTSAAVFGDRRRAVLAVLLIGAALTATIGVGFLKHYPPATYLIDAFGLVLASALVLVVRQMSRLIHELSATRRQLADSAVAEERLRFARDLHDLLGHTLSLIVVKAEVVRRLAERDPAAAAAQAADIEEVGRRALAEIREAVTGYREAGLTAELTRARSDLAAAGVEAFVRRTADSLPSSVDALLAWVVREAVTNVIRHAVATECELALYPEKNVVTLTVSDNGRGTASSFGNGLTGLAERVSAVGGTLVAGPREGGGFRLTATVPAAALVKPSGVASEAVA